jgi:hypothetical protein
MNSLLRVQYSINPDNTIRIVILEQDESIRKTGWQFTHEGFTLESMACPEITRNRLYIRGTRREKDSLPAAQSSYYTMHDTGQWLARLAATVCALNGLPPPEYLKPSGVLG